MHKRNGTATVFMSQIVVDLCMVWLAYIMASFLYQLTEGAPIFKRHIWMPFAFSTVFILVMFIMRMYNTTTFFYLDRVAMRTFLSVAVGALFISMMIFLMQLKNTSRLLFVYFLILTYVLVFGVRLLSRKLRLKVKNAKAVRVLFIGERQHFEKYRHYLSQTAAQYKFVAAKEFDDAVVGDVEQFEAYLIEKQVDEVHFLCGDQYTFNYKDFLLVCEKMGLTAKLVMNMYELPVSKRYVSSIGTYPVITYHSVSMNALQMFFKSAFDYIASSILLLLVLPVFACVAAAIKIESPGPVLFKQKRVGLNGKVFTIYKFRSMFTDAEERKEELAQQNKISDGLMFKIDNDPRVTKVGAFIRKTSIDELPQLWNVLKGDMSMVGTRPPTLDEVERYEAWHRRRISIKPGITGMWQVSGRSNVLDFKKIVEYDCMYIDQWSLALDINILFKTFAVVLKRKGAY